MHQNSIMVVKPYKWEGMWVFDDEKTGLCVSHLWQVYPKSLKLYWSSKASRWRRLRRAFA